MKTIALIFWALLGVHVIFTLLYFLAKVSVPKVLRRDYETSFTMETHKVWLEEQRKRKELMEGVCDQLAENNINYKQLVALKDQKENLFKKMIVDDKSRVLFCLIPKIASTTWRSVLRTLRQQNYPRSDSNLTRLFTLRPEDALLRFKTYQKVIIVRHPFERLLSAFRDKFEDPSHKQTYEKYFGEEMVPNYEMGNDINFTTFINYLIKNSDSLWRNPLGHTCHWTQYSKLCEPCLIHYDFILHYETLMPDSEHMLYQINAPHNLKFPNRTSSNTTSLLQQYFGFLDEEQLSDIYSVYKKDFALFGYKSNITSF